MQVNVGEATFNTFTLGTLDGTRSVDLTKLFLEMNIIEDVFKEYMYGDVTISDEINIYNGLPILGEEVLNVSFTAQAGTEIRTYKFYCYHVNSVAMDKNSKYQVYRLNFISYDQFLVSQKISSFGVNNTTISAAIQSLLTSSNLTSNVAYIQPTTGVVNYTLPLNTVIDNIKYLKSKAYTSTKSDSNVWLFYETSNGYYLQTVSNMITTGLQRMAALQANNIPTNINIGVYDQVHPLMNPEFISRAAGIYALGERDTLSGLRQGHYNSNLLVYDLATRTLVNYSDTYQNSFSNFIHTDNTTNFPVQSLYFQNTVASSTPYTEYLVGDSTKPDFSTTTSTYNTRNMYSQSLEEYPFTVTIPGDPVVYPGDIMSVDLPERSPSTIALDKFKSGNYLVGTQIHNFKQFTKYNMTLILYKDCAISSIETQKQTQSVAL
jgi:hypothetical protein